MFITISLVTYHNSFKDLKKIINSVKLISEKFLFYIVDNSNNRDIEVLCDIDSIIYIKNEKNIGFGAGHNIAINKAIDLKSDYHLIVNPDIYFDKNVIEELIVFFRTDESIGLLMPKVLFPNKNTQYLCKLLPTPFDLFFRRFLPFKKIKENLNIRYELRFTKYNKIMNVPYLSGCFMFCKTSALKNVGGFDERFFMYLEDIDLSRRIHEKYKTLFFPNVHIYHKFEKGSYKNKKLLKYHISSSIKYFNKWGWFFDFKRKKINAKTLSRLNGKF
ncbi:glycosyltransferase family 2 protein [uncultured Maribacter sp.]|uniref:glycosyltransferase family 2 protein n=1 Tax=uncultured Maribacter sp. TaxID=431308 RepID=UPI00260CE551|nr:glycosyltransferase family 2 protein [uncultured Maribacter sp.]